MVAVGNQHGMLVQPLTRCVSLAPVLQFGGGRFWRQYQRGLLAPGVDLHQNGLALGGPVQLPLAQGPANGCNQRQYDECRYDTKRKRCVGHVCDNYSFFEGGNMRFIVILVFLGILASLASAFLYLMRDKGGSNRTVNALTVRIGLSIALFLFILFANYMGWIQSTGIGLRQ